MTTAPTMQLPQMIKADISGRVGLVKNDYGRPVTLMVCVGCGQLFTVTGDQSVDEWGSGCLGFNCQTYDMDRDVDLTFALEPWRVTRS